MRITPIVPLPARVISFEDVAVGVPFLALRGYAPLSYYMKIMLNGGGIGVVLFCHDGDVMTVPIDNGIWRIEKVFSNHELILRD